jgi:spore germination protein GerM
MSRAHHLRPGRAGRALAALALAILGVSSVAGCGLPQSTTPTVIAPTDVPYRLADPRQSSPATSGGRDATTVPHVFLLTTEGLLTPVAAPLRPDGLVPVVRALLARLVQGPDAQQRATGLATALGSGFELRLEGVEGRTAVVALDPGERDPSSSRLPLAVGQVVLTVTSVEGVDAVRFVRDGAAAEVPLPDGALTASVVSRSDYASLVSSRVRSSGKADPRPSPSS